MARFLKLSLLVLFLTALTSQIQGATAEDLQSMYLKAWLEIQNGFNLKDTKDYRGATARFKDAYNILSQIHRIDPTWEAATVSARTRDCQRMLSELPRYSDQAPTTASDGNNTGGNTSSTQTSASAEAAYQDLVNHNKALKMELDRTKGDLAIQEGLVVQDRKEKSLKDGRIAALTQELEGLRSQHPGSDVDSAKLALENKDLKERQVVLEEQIKTLTEGGTNAAVGRLRDQLNAVQAELTSSEQANSTLQAANNALKSQLESEINRVNNLLATAQNDTQLVRENTMLRDMLRHELQEQDRKEAAKRLAIEEFANLRIQSRVLKTQIQIITSPVVFLTPEEKEMAKTLIMPEMPLTDTVPKQPDFKIAQGDVPSPSPAPETSSPTPVTPSTETPSPTPSMADTTPTPSPSPADVVQATPTPSASPSPDMASASPTPAPDAVAAQPTPVVSTYQPTPNPSDVTPTPPPADETTTTAVIPSTTTEFESKHVYTPAATPDPHDPTHLAKDPVVPGEMRAMAEEGAALFKMKRYDEAAARYESIIQKYPESLYAWSNLGVVRFQQGDYPESKKALQQAIKLSPNDALCRRNLGIVYYQIGSYEAAIDELTQSISMDSTDPLSHEYLGLACYQKGWVETCLKQLNKSLEIDDDQPAVHLYLSQVYANERSQLDEGRKHYKRALELGVAKNEELEKKLQM